MPAEKGIPKPEFNCDKLDKRITIQEQPGVGFQRIKDTLSIMMARYTIAWIPLT